MCYKVIKILFHSKNFNVNVHEKNIAYQTVLYFNRVENVRLILNSTKL